MILGLFSKCGLTQVFEIASQKSEQLSDNAARILRMKASYLQTIGTVIDFLQDKNPTLAYRILWIGAQPDLLDAEEGFCELVFSGKKEDFAIELPLELGEWVVWLLAKVSYE